MELILHFSVHYANIRVFCETTKFWEEFLLHAQAVTVAILINVRKTALSDCLQASLHYARLLYLLE